MNELTKSTPYSHFKIGSPVLLKENATAKRRNVQEDWPEKRRVPVERSFAQILGVSFGLLLTLMVFPKLLIAPFYLLKKVLLVAASYEELLVARETVMYSLQN